MPLKKIAQFLQAKAGINDTSGSYQNRVAQQVKQFADLESLKKLPGIYHYWMKTYIIPRFRSVSNCTNIMDFYVSSIVPAIKQSKHAHIVSLGSGDAVIEQQLAEKLLSSGLTNFTLHCLELSDDRIGRAKERVKSLQVNNFLSFEVTDLNAWSPTTQLDAVIATSFIASCC